MSKVSKSKLKQTASSPWSLQRDGIYILEVKDMAISQDDAISMTRYYRKRYNVDIQVVFTRGDGFSLQFVPSLKPKTPLTQRCVNKLKRLFRGIS